MRRAPKDAGGVAYGNRWSREARDHRIHNARQYPTPAGVVYRIHDGWYLIRDPAGVNNGRQYLSGGRSLRSDHRLIWSDPVKLRYSR
jgi:hypothetical protein